MSTKAAGDPRSSNEPFVYLAASPDPMRCPSMDHAAVELVERGLEDYGFLKLHNFYLRYRLPLMIEVQCFEWSHPPAQGATA